MRNRFAYFRPVIDYLALLSWVFGLLLLVPLVVRFVAPGPAEVPAAVYWAPAALALVAGAVLKRSLRFPALDTRRAMMICALGWIVVSAIGAIPFLGVGMSPVDAYFESVSGFTTTGITMIQGIENLPRSILFWRSFIQWLGGLGILTFFLAILYTSGSAHRIFSAEGHKVFSKRPAPGIFHTLRILWTVYAVYTVAVAVLLALEGLSVFDAAAHAMTCLSTGGYSPHDLSIGYYRANADAYPHYRLIEYTVTLGMLLGGINFFVHFRVLTGGVRALWDSLEMRLWWLFVAGAAAVIMLDHYRASPGAGFEAGGVEPVFRTCLFQTVAILTTTGFATQDINSAYFPAAARQVFLALMVIGGCVGSTGGGIKVLRIGVLLKMVGRHVRRLVYGPAAVNPVVVDGDVVVTDELRRVSALFFAWIAFIVFGGLVTALLSGHDALSSASGMFSAMGNIGPSYLSVAEMSALNPVVKIVYVLGMLAGRLEILPLLILFSPRTWR